jgi:hypothetical protein
VGGHLFLWETTKNPEFHLVFTWIEFIQGPALPFSGLYAMLHPIQLSESGGPWAAY